MTKRPSTSQGTSSVPKRPPLTRSHSDSKTSIAPAEQPEPAVHSKIHVGSASNGSAILIKKRVVAPDPVAPSRPPRNPSRPSTATIGQKTTTSRVIRPSTSTGTREEVTPWELYPAPDYGESSALGHGQIPTRQGPPPPTSASGLHLSDLALVKRRKSTGSKPPSKFTNHVAPFSSFPLQETRSTLNPPAGTTSTTKFPAKSTPNSPKLLPKAAVLTPAPLSPFISALPSVVPKPPPVAHTNPSQRQSLLALPKGETNPPNLKFSTADRTILEELKRNITARAAQFVFKGGTADVGNVSGWGAQAIGAGKKHHPYPKDEVPYPRNYERDVIDLDVWETAFCQQLCGSLTYHVFDQPPSRVLDLGCGSGSWILNCSRSWKQSSFVGLDIVPLHPDLQQVGSPDLAARITWVQANFLDGLPFPNEEFDFVHVKRISLGVPEDKWDALLEEITRVMKPGAAFEMIEEDLFFPGKSPDDDTEPGTSSASRSLEDVNRSRYRQTLPPSAFENLAKHLERTDHDPDHDSDSLTGSGSGGSPRNSFSTSGRHSDEFAWTPTSASAAGSSPIAPNATPPRSVSPPLREVDPIVEDVEAENADALASIPVSPIIKSPSVINLRERQALAPIQVIRPSVPPSRTQLSQSTQRGSGFHVANRSQRSGKFSGSADWMMASLAPTNNSFQSVNFQGNSIDHRPSFSSTQQTLITPSSPVAPGKRAPFVLRSIPRPPQNPRNHSLLALIYTEMCESRFINLSPLSLLANHLVLHFNDVRTHPPLQFTFPPRPKPPTTTSNEPVSDPDEEARDAIIPNPPKPSPPPSEAITPRPVNSSSYFSIPVSNNADEEARFLSIRGLIQGASQYVTLDDTRVSAFSPSKKASFSPPLTKQTFEPKATVPTSSVFEKTGDVVPGQVKARAMSLRQNRLPNATLHMDLRTLNLHLAARVAEVLACSESMWEWIVDYQKVQRAKKAEQHAKVTQRARAGSVETALHQRRVAAVQEPSLKSAIEDLTREDFDTLLNRFAMDMRDQTALGPALQERFSWSVLPTSPTSERKAFDNEYSLWLEDENRRELEHEQTSRRPMSMVGNSSSTFLDLLSSEKTDGHPSDPLLRRQVVKKASSMSTGSNSSTSTLAPPNRKLSRAMRVFVGWKPLT